MVLEGGNWLDYKNIIGRSINQLYCFESVWMPTRLPPNDAHTSTSSKQYLSVFFKKWKVPRCKAEMLFLKIIDLTMAPVSLLSFSWTQLFHRAEYVTACLDCASRFITLSHRFLFYWSYCNTNVSIYDLLQNNVNLSLLNNVCQKKLHHNTRLLYRCPLDVMFCQ